MILHLEDKLIFLGKELRGKSVSRCDKGQFFTLQLKRASLWKRKHIRLPDKLHIARKPGIRSQLRKGIEVIGHGPEKPFFNLQEVLRHRQIPVPAAKHGQGRHKHGYRPVAARVTAAVIDRCKQDFFFQSVR